MTARHVVVIVIDTLRADHLPIYGYDKNTAPFLQELAAESTVFTHAVTTSSFTAEAISSLFTGMYPSATSWGGGWYARPAPDAATLATTFKAAGYATALFSNSPVLDSPEFYRGFDETYCFTKFGVSGQGPYLVSKATEWLAAHQDEPTFTYLHFLDPHSPYTPPDDYRRRFGDAQPETPLGLYEDVRWRVPSLVADGFGPGEARFDNLVQRYDGEIAFNDDALRSLFEAFESMGMADNTLAMIMADHGEEFLDHGFVEHAWTLYPEAHHIPLLLWQPGRLPATRVTETVSIVDIMPTAISLQGIAQSDVLSGAPLFQRENDGSWRPAPHTEPRIMELVIQSRNVVRGVVTNDILYLAYWKWLPPEACAEAARLIRGTREEIVNGQVTPIDTWGPIVREELYDLRTDPGARHNRADEDPEGLSRWRTYLLEYGGSCPPQLSDRYKATRDSALLSPDEQVLLEKVPARFLQPVESDDTHDDALKALGYL